MDYDDLSPTTSPFFINRSTLYLSSSRVISYFIFSYDHVMLNNASQQVTQQPLPSHPVRSIMPANAPYVRSIPPRLINTEAPVTSHMMTLSKCGTMSAPPPKMDLSVQGLPSKLKADDWVRAAEFVPGQKWQALSGEYYLQILHCIKCRRLGHGTGVCAWAEMLVTVVFWQSFNMSTFQRALCKCLDWLNNITWILTSMAE